MPLTPEQFRRAEDLFHKASSLPEEQREEFVRRACSDDEQVRVEVQGLLTHANTMRSPPPLTHTIHKHLSQTMADQQRQSGLSLVGQVIGNYQVQRLVGRGGMGVVYQAIDTRLQRSVAIKALPPELATAPHRLARFSREAKLLASLSHPNIATVYGLEEHEGARFLVMEWIEGRTLAQRLQRGPLPIEEAVDAARQVAAALETAHEAGVIHRDLKPGNVMVTAAGRVKVLDFGLARQDEPAGDGTVEARPAGATVHLETREGAVMGTPGYMSPEQVRGRPVDRRTDIFAFGCILYECLTGNMAFTGQTGADIIAAVLEREPEWARLPAKTPAGLRRLLARCTAKDAGQRVRDIGDVRMELEDVLAARPWITGTATGEFAAPTAPRRTWLRPGAAVALVVPLVLGALAAVALLPWRRAPAPPPPTLHRLTLPFPGPTPQTNLARLQLALTRDGRRLTYIAAQGGGPMKLWVHDLDQWEPRALDGTAGAVSPIFSPDGQWVAYWLDGVLMKRRADGGDAQRVSDVVGWGGDWGDDGAIAFVPTWSKPVTIVRPDGTTAAVTTVEFDKGELAHLHPTFTRDGRAVLYTAWYGHDRTQVHASRINETGHTVVVDSGGYPQLARAGDTLYLLWIRRGTIFAAPFDETTLRLTGPEAAIVDGVLTDAVLFDAVYDASDTGLLAFVPGPVYYEETRLAWLDPRKPDTPPTPLNDDRQPFGEPHLSADGAKLSVVLKREFYLGYVYDLTRGTFDRISGAGDTATCAIAPDGNLVAYGSNREGRYGLYLRALADGSDRMIVEPVRDYIAQVHWSPDSKTVAFCMSPDDTLPRDLWVANIDHEPGTPPSVRQLWPTPTAEESNPAFSPNGQWLAYASNETLTREVYVRSFPDGRIKRQLSMGGGNWPEWSPDGKALYFRRGAAIYAVPVDPQTAAPQAAPALLWEGDFGQSDFDLTDYTVAPDGRLLLVQPSEKAAPVSNLRVMLNWHTLVTSAR